jgi:hypothetical protein
MRNLTRSIALASVLTPLALACSAPKQLAARKLPEAMVDRCLAASSALSIAMADGSHQPSVLTLAGGKMPASEKVVAPWTEQHTAEYLIATPPNTETWVIARGGMGKSHLARSLEALTCAKRMTFRIDVGLDLRPKLELATPTQPAIARVLLAQMGIRPGEDPATQLHDELQESPWLLLLDGTDELTQSERRKLENELDWLAGDEFGQHIVRFERPGMVDTKPAKPPATVLYLPELTCTEVDAELVRRFPIAADRITVQKWLTAHRLDRKRPTKPGDPADRCQYVHMSTHRDVETLADLAQDALTETPGETRLDDLPMDPVRTDLYATWLFHRLRGMATTAEGALTWLDRIAAQGVMATREPDLALSVNRCEGVSAPGGIEPGPVCRKLMQSAVVRKGELSGVTTLAHRTLMDLLFARWQVRAQPDCALLNSAVSELGSLEITAMVASLPEGRRCLNPIVAAVCSRGIAVPDIVAFVDEAVPVGVRDPAFFAIATERAKGKCEHAVFEGLQGQ